MHIREMTIVDYDAVYALWLSCKGMGLNDFDDSRDGIERFLKHNPETCFVAENDRGQIIGAIITGNDGRRGYIYHTAVNPGCRRQGVGKGLVDTAVKKLKSLGIGKVALVVFERNSDGNKFWESIGFTVREDLVYRNLALTEMIRTDT